MLGIAKIKRQTYRVLICLLRISLTIFIFAHISCSNKLSPFYKHNSYLNDFNNFVINDSLRFIHKTYGKIEFPKTKGELLDFAKLNFPLANSILFAAHTQDSSHIKYAILLNPKNKKLILKSGYHSRDTLIGKNHFMFISNKKWTLQGWELKNSFIDAFYIGDDYKKKMPSLFEFQNNCSQSITYLSCLAGYLDYPDFDESTNDMKLQLALTYSSFLGNNYIYTKLLEQYTNKEDLSKEISAIKDKGLNGWSEVSKKILDLARDNQILMFSENHFIPNHRKTLTNLLPELKKNGYSYLALEALSMGADSLLNSGSKVLNTMGYYTREQNFIELIETAQNLGFNIVAYDDFKENRELIQAHNIYTRTLKQNPNAKIIILGGFGHINEEPNSKGDQMMAGHLKSISGINPLTISQTTFSKYSFKNLKQSILIEKDWIPLKFEMKTDYSLIHPNFHIKPEDKESNFTYQNSNDFDVQLDIYRVKDLEHLFSHVKMPPLKSILISGNNKIEVYLKPGTTYRYFVTDKNVISIDVGDIPL